MHQTSRNPRITRAYMQKLQQKLTDIFQKARCEPEGALSHQIWQVIAAREKRNTQIKVWVFASAGIASFAALLPVLKILYSDLSQSGLYEYFSLLFAGGSILSYWKEIVLSVVESLPVLSMVLTLSLIFICFLSMRYLVRQFGRNNYYQFKS